MIGFTLGRTPRLHFGDGAFGTVTDLVGGGEYRRVAIVTGGSSFREGEAWPRLIEATVGGAEVRDFVVSGEPSPPVVDAIVDALRDFRPELVVAVGGGSVIDAGKAVSAMVREEASVADFLEGVGSRTPSGLKIPLVAVPTTAGTGSEATKNAVLSSVGARGYKKSLRHDNYVPEIAVVDPRLALGCPRDVTAAAGMDAVTQLLEAFVSTEASPLTDSLARGGLLAASMGVPAAVANPADIEARARAAYAAYLSGVALANAGLGVVHGLASPLGARMAAPHGAICGSLVASATRRIVDLLEIEAGRSDYVDSAAAVALGKYAEAGVTLGGDDRADRRENCRLLVNTLEAWTEEFSIPRLSAYGMTAELVADIVAEAGAKNTPVALTGNDIAAILIDRL